MSSEKFSLAIGDQSFEAMKRTNPHGAEFWSARDLQPLLGYNHWRSFENAITKAITSCEQSGNEPEHHFARAGKMIAVGKGGQREVPDFQLSRFACLLPDCSERRFAKAGDCSRAEVFCHSDAAAGTLRSTGDGSGTLGASQASVGRVQNVVGSGASGRSSEPALRYLS